MPTLGGARATQKNMQTAAGGMSDANAAVLSGADLERKKLQTVKGLSDANTVNKTGADLDHYNANN